MADFGYFQAEANKNGLVLCMICFNGKPRDQMVPVEGRYFCPSSGEAEDTKAGGFDVCCAAPKKHVPVVEDVCKACQEIEDKLAAMSEEDRRKLLKQPEEG